jgi:hypothetical protein
MSRQFRIPGGEGLTDFPAREPFRPSEVIEAWAVLLDQLPQGSRRHTGRQRATELI